MHKAGYRLISTLWAALAVLVLGAGLARAEVATAPVSAVSGVWHGTWTSKTHAYSAELTLAVTPDGTAEGAIHWVLRKTNRPELAKKVGMSGVELVHGKFFTDSAALIVDGYRLDDPNHILGMDRYRLILSDDRKLLGGPTYSGGKWDGRIYLTR